MEISKKFLDNKERRDKQFEGKEELIDYVECQECGTKFQQITHSHFKVCPSGLTLKEYKSKNSKYPLVAESITKNYGQHMKTDEMKKKYSEMFKGENNPNHRSNTTELKRKQTSPYSIEFYKKKYPNKTLEEQNELLKKFLNKQEEGKLRPTQLEYYVNKGYSEDEAKELLKERQSTFTKEKCIKKYGKKKGLKVWNERHRNWSKKMEEKYKNGEFSRFSNFSSNVSNELISSIVDEMNLNEDSYSSALNKGGEFSIRNDENLLYSYDFLHKDSKSIIEFNGDFWHANPRIYESDFINRVTKKSASDIWKYDEKKAKFIEDRGYRVLHIWEDDYRKNPEKEIKKCIGFINEDY